MPIRRVPATPTPEKAPSAAAEKEPEEASSEESPAAEEEPAAPSAVPAGGEDGDAASETEPTENGEKAEDPAEEKVEEGTGNKEDKCKDCASGQCATHCYVLLPRMKDGYKYVKAKSKKVKRAIPAWASVAAGKKLPVANFAGTQHKVDNILIEAIASSNDKSGVSFQSFMKYILKKYPEMELGKKKFLLKKAMKKHLEKGTIKQLKGKGLSGSFAIGKQSVSKKAAVKAEALGDALPLIITRLCEPKEASYYLIRKYLEQHFPGLNIQNRPELLKSALVKAVEKGHLEQITGKGANGTFQLKRTGNHVLLKGSNLEDAITTAITAMNEPKTCSTTILRRYLVDTNKDRKEYQLMASLRRTLMKCKVLGWMEQISGHGFTGTYQLSFPFYPSPTILYPEKFNDLTKITPPSRQRRKADSSDEEEEEEAEEEKEDEDDDEEEEEEAPPRRRSQKRPPPKVRRPPPAKKSRSSSQSKAKGRGRSLAKKSPAKKAASPAKKAASPAKKAASPAKKAASPAKRGGRKSSTSKKESPPPPKATPVKRGAPAKKPKTPAVKKLAKRGAKRPVYRDSSPEEAEEEVEEEEEEEEEVVVPKETTRSGSKRSKPEDSPAKEPVAKRAAATRGGSKSPAAEVKSPKKPVVKKGAAAKSAKKTTRRSKRGKY
ncbi:heterochromatin protein 1-binding protein 3 [Pseudoliparis swirei]|uniref:heterochromatin protein 1-binding protein 3 n=1 Tax=Pseudoliparis swirei TaxID=2059687 RepID=UPI0024BEDDFD|nr:heterochromatin protein 1-binding protein 3 [Pseudoliparis swirei]XP_056294108.1 heterochromatin protein 1-binding protein 3 [Pseudoliparis swirei]